MADPSAETPIRFGGASAGSARKGLVLLHGRGGSAEDILGLGEALAMPDLALAAPQAVGHTWWPMSFLAPMAQMATHLDHGLSKVQRSVAALQEPGLDLRDIAVAGFSQGGCLALEYGARTGGLAGVFGLSAGLIGTGDADGEGTAELHGFGPKRFDYNTDLTGTTVTITVHAQDPHIPLKRAQDSLSVFQALRADARLHVAPGAGHGLTQEGVSALRAALNR